MVVSLGYRSMTSGYLFFIIMHRSISRLEFVVNTALRSLFQSPRLKGKRGFQSSSRLTRRIQSALPSKMAAKNLAQLSREELNQFLNSFDTVLTDCDGVLWIWQEAIKGSPEAISKLKKIGKRVFYVTNNSTKTRAELFEKTRLLGYESSEDEIVSTAHLAVKYLQDRKFNKKVYIVGSTGITQELDQAGIKHLPIGPDVMPATLAELTSQTLDPEVGAVVVGFDEHISYPKLLRAASYLNNPDCLFVATNTDERFPMSTSLVVPGTGSIVRSVETCSERQAFVVGKPSSYIGDYLVKNHKIDPKRTIMIGDRCNTDILLGAKCGFQTLLVLSGVTTLEDVEAWKKSSRQEDKELIPDYYLSKLGDLVPLIE